MLTVYLSTKVGGGQRFSQSLPLVPWQQASWRRTLGYRQAATVLCRLLMFLNPNSKWPIILEQTVTIPLITVFFTTWRASISDKLSGASYAAANAKIGISAGLAIVLGPMLCKAVMARGHVKYW